LVVEDAGAVVAVFEVPAAEFDCVLAGGDDGGEVGVEVEGAVDVVWSEPLGAASFFSAAAGAGASLPADGFILSE
jgi:hypothetical protein